MPSRDTHQTVEATVRRVPRYGVLMGIGVVLGVIAAGILTMVGSFEQSQALDVVYPPGQVFGFLLLWTVPIGLALGGAAGHLPERIARRHAPDVPAEPIGHRDREVADPPDSALRQRQHLYVQLEGVRAAPDVALELGDRARVRPIGVPAGVALHRTHVPVVCGGGIAERGAGMRSDRRRERLGAGRREGHQRVETVDQLQGDAGVMSPRLHGHVPVALPLGLDLGWGVDRVGRTDRQVAEGRQIQRRPDAQQLAQGERDEHGDARVFADEPLRLVGHGPIVGGCSNRAEPRHGNARGEPRQPSL